MICAANVDQGSRYGSHRCTRQAKDCSIWCALHDPERKWRQRCTAAAQHITIPLQVWVDIDEGIAGMVRYLNTLPGVRTLASCQGTIGEGGPKPYRAQVMASWPPELTEGLASEFDITPLGDNWGYLHPLEAPE